VLISAIQQKMIIRKYKPEDQEVCLEIFKSNCPKYFDEAEYELFNKWLNHQNNNAVEYSSPTYQNTLFDSYSVIENEAGEVVACGGFYITNEGFEARLAWGMVHADMHSKGYGIALFENRKKEIETNWPNYAITLGTSQHTYPFYEKMGMRVINFLEKGYGENLDRYDMKG
jgi:hypothetical protein